MFVCNRSNRIVSPHSELALVHAIDEKSIERIIEAGAAMENANVKSAEYSHQRCVTFCRSIAGCDYFSLVVCVFVRVCMRVSVCLFSLHWIPCQTNVTVKRENYISIRASLVVRLSNVCVHGCMRV